MDFTKLDQLVGGNDDRRGAYLTMLNEDLTATEENLSEAIKHVDRERIRSIVHRIRPQLAFYSMQEALQCADNIQLVYENCEQAMLQTRVDQLILYVRSARQQIENRNTPG